MLVDETCEFGVSESELNRRPPFFPPVAPRYGLRACIESGRGMLIFRAYTFAHWYFDDSGVLVHVEVIRATDAL